MTDLLTRLRGGLIVSCQALPAEPLFGAEIMARMAAAAAEGGAVGIRAGSPPDIAAIRAADRAAADRTVESRRAGVRRLHHAPRRRRRRGRGGGGGHHRPGRHRPPPPRRRRRGAGSSGPSGGRRAGPCWRTSPPYEEALAAQDAGAEFISTTMSGYTPDSPQQPGPDLDLVRRLAGVLHRPPDRRGPHRHARARRGRRWTPGRSPWWSAGPSRAPSRSRPGSRRPCGMYLGIDIGGTKIAGALVTERGEVLRRAARPTPAREGGAQCAASGAGRGAVAGHAGRRRHRHRHRRSSGRRARRHPLRHRPAARLGRHPRQGRL